MGALCVCDDEVSPPEVSFSPRAHKAAIIDRVFEEK